MVSKVWGLSGNCWKLIFFGNHLTFHEIWRGVWLEINHVDNFSRHHRRDPATAQENNLSKDGFLDHINLHIAEWDEEEFGQRKATWVTTNVNKAKSMRLGRKIVVVWPCCHSWWTRMLISGTVEIFRCKAIWTIDCLSFFLYSCFSEHFLRIKDLVFHKLVCQIFHRFFLSCIVFNNLIELLIPWAIFR